MLQILSNTILNTAIFIIISLPFVLYKKFFGWTNFAIGGLYLVGGFGFWICENNLKLGIIVSLLITFAVTISFVIIIHYIYNCLKLDNNQMTIFVVSLVISDIIHNLCHGYFGSSVRIFELSNQHLDFLGISTNTINLFIIILSILLFAIIYYLFAVSGQSLKFKAIAEPSSKLGNLGKSSNLEIAIILLAIGALSCASGIVLAAEYNLNINLVIFGTKAWVLSILSMNNLRTLPFVCFGISLIESICTLIVPFGLKDAIVYLIIVGFLVLEKKNNCYESLPI
jgi:branched-subunit amino acid ABC-type transport system permease component